MSEEYRGLLYPLGFIAQIAFGLRFLVQWLAAEKQHKSVTPKIFWKLSLIGNIVLLCHSVIQLHFPMTLAQSINATLSWRNLNLLESKKSQVSIHCVWLMLAIAISTPIAFFSLSIEQPNWIATPSSLNIATNIHLLGMVGIFCFSLRFWVQWWQAENKKEGSLTERFWWISLLGSALSSIYFFTINDWVNFIGPALSLVPYSRNLYFLKKA